VEHVLSVELRHHAKFRGDPSKCCRDITIFGFFNMTAAAILDFFNVKFLTVTTVKKSNGVTVPHFVQIAQTVAEICQFSIF